jgi:uncharacterized membrane protein
MNNLSFYIHGNAEHGNGILDLLTHVLGLFDGLTIVNPENGFYFLLGLFEIANIHPLLVHFPIAFLTFFVIIDLLGTVVQKNVWRVFASSMLYIGMLTTVVTVWAGLRASETVPHGHEVHDVMTLHQNFGIAILVLGLIMSALRLRHSPKGWGIHSFFSILLLTLLIMGADLGGQMVYKYGVAVQAVMVSPNDHHHHDDSTNRLIPTAAFNFAIKG